MNLRTTLTVFGVATGAVGLAFVLDSGLAAGVGVDRLFVFLAGFAAVLLAVADLRVLRATTVDQASVEDVEEGPEYPGAGAEVDALLSDAAQGYDRTTQTHRDRIEARIREAAIDVLTRQEECTPEAAEAMLAEGSWTDDPYAAAFLGAHDPEGLPIRERVSNALRPEARFARRADHAIHAVADREEGDS